MGRNPRYNILFEPVQIGPVTTRNRFFQVPHASSTGHELPNIRAGLRSIRAEGGWGVVCTGYCSIHPSSDDAPHRYSRLWDDKDVRNLVHWLGASSITAVVMCATCIHASQFCHHPVYLLIHQVVHHFYTVGPWIRTILDLYAAGR